MAMFPDNKQSAVNKTANLSFRVGFSPYKRWKTILSKPKCKISKGIYSSRIYSKQLSLPCYHNSPPPPPHTHISQKEIQEVLSGPKLEDKIKKTVINALK